MEHFFSYLLAPLATGFAGWFANAHRNRQKKEADRIEVARQYKALLDDALEDKRKLYDEIDKLREELREVRDEIAVAREERTMLKIAISRATKCEHRAVCPVIADMKTDAPAEKPKSTRKPKSA